MIAETTNPC
jgi:hypothetical protein